MKMRRFFLFSSVIGFVSSGMTLTIGFIGKAVGADTNYVWFITAVLFAISVFLLMQSRTRDDPPAPS